MSRQIWQSANEEKRIFESLAFRSSWSVILCRSTFLKVLFTYYPIIGAQKRCLSKRPIHSIQWNRPLSRQTNFLPDKFLTTSSLAFPIDKFFLIRKSILRLSTFKSLLPVTPEKLSKHTSDFLSLSHCPLKSLDSSSTIDRLIFRLSESELPSKLLFQTAC